MFYEVYIYRIAMDLANSWTIISNSVYLLDFLHFLHLPITLIVTII